MPWSETTPMKERLRFIKDYGRGLFKFSELCAQYSVSRKTGYKWLGRFERDGAIGLADRSRAPKTCAHQTAPETAEQVLAARRKHPTWGPKKLVVYLKRRAPKTQWPAASTVGALLKRAGLVTGRRRKPHPGHPGPGQTPMDAPNAVWTADFKGEFKTRDGEYCYPLTVEDGYSRYLLACQALASTRHELVQPVFERLFREYGLPGVIRTDNGVPFASQAICRLSRLHIWWIKLGIRPELIQPAHPQQNGRHERMHRTLKREATQPLARNAAGQQRNFNRFRKEYNQIRPHEAVGQVVPATLYQPSSRPYPRQLPEIEYPAHYEVRLVSRNGGIRWQKQWVNVSHVLAEENIGLEEVADGIWAVYFGPLRLGHFDERELRLSGAYAYNRPE